MPRGRRSSPARVPAWMRPCCAPLLLLARRRWLVAQTSSMARRRAVRRRRPRGSPSSPVEERIRLPLWTGLPRAMKLHGLEFLGHPEHPPGSVGFTRGHPPGTRAQGRRSPPGHARVCRGGSGARKPAPRPCTGQPSWSTPVPGTPAGSTTPPVPMTTPTAAAPQPSPILWFSSSSAMATAPRGGRGRRVTVGR